MGSTGEADAEGADSRWHLLPVLPELVSKSIPEGVWVASLCLPQSFPLSWAAQARPTATPCMT